MRILCHTCGDPVSTEVPDDTLLSVLVQCAECAEAEEEAEQLRDEARTVELAEAYQRGVRAGKMLAMIQCADLVAALPNEVTVTDYHYRNGWRDACAYAEMRIRALETDVEEKPCRHVCIDCGLAFRPSERCRLCTKGHDREQLRKRRAICQCGNAAKYRPCKMSCPGSEVEP